MLNDEGPTPRISVVIPCFNDGAYVGDAVASVRESEDVAVIVVDDCSTDPLTASVAEELNRHPAVTVLRHSHNQGVAAAMDTGIRSARTPYVFFLGADDLAEAGALAPMADDLDSDDDLGVVWGAYSLFGARTGSVRVPPFDPWQVTYVNRWPGVAMVRVRDYVRVGGFDPSALFEDWDLWLSFAEAGIKGLAREVPPTFRYRIHPGTSRRHSRGTEQFGREYRSLRRRHPALYARRRELSGKSPLGARTKMRERLGLWLLLVTPGRWRWTHSVVGDAVRRVRAAGGHGGSEAAGTTRMAAEEPTDT
ncbi:MAG TPA: glycosyltransferase [Ornithinibacter sp.]|nr:glycosyltransferase [Ornithinibacter sp.]